MTAGWNDQEISLALGASFLLLHSLKKNQQPEAQRLFVGTSLKRFELDVVLAFRRRL